MIILWIFWNCFFNWLLLFSVSFLVNHLQIFPCLMSNFTEFSPCFKWTAWKSSQLSLSHESINKIIGRCFSGRINNSFTCCFCFSWPSCFVRCVHCAFETFTFKLLNKLLTFMQNWRDIFYFYFEKGQFSSDLLLFLCFVHRVYLPPDRVDPSPPCTQTSRSWRSLSHLSHLFPRPPLCTSWATGKRTKIRVEEASTTTARLKRGPGNHPAHETTGSVAGTRPTLETWR